MLSAVASASFLPLLLAAGGLGASLSLWGVISARLCIALLGVSLLIGQVARLPLPGQGGGVLVSDVAVVLTLASTVVLYLKRPSLIFKNHVLLTLALGLPFILWTTWTTLIHLPQFAAKEQVIMLAYWIRLVSHLLLLPALCLLLTQPKVATFAQNLLIFTGVSLATVGLSQWWLLPDLSFLAASGWDPHQGRLVATWLDPNFFGAFLAILIPFMLATPFPISWRMGMATLAVLALLLTRSRSSILALILALTLLSPFLTFYFLRRISLAKLILFICIVALGILALIGAVALWGDRAASLLTQQDPTLSLRLKALVPAAHLAAQHFWIGTGYNAYQFIAQKGPSPDFTIHSRAGADSSLLTLWVTVGLIGLVLFLIYWSGLAAVVAHAWLIKKNNLATAALIAMTTIFIHSFLVNSLLYSHLLIAVMIMLALVFSQPSQENKT